MHGCGGFDRANGKSGEDGWLTLAVAHDGVERPLNAARPVTGEAELRCDAVSNPYEFVHKGSIFADSLHRILEGLPLDLQPGPC